MTNPSPPRRFCHATGKTAFAFVLISLIFFLLISFNKASPKSLDQGATVLSLISIASFWLLVFSGDCLFWKIPGLKSFLRSQGWLKSPSLGQNKSREADSKEKFYVEKVRSMNLVTSITAVAVTVILLLNLELRELGGQGRFEEFVTYFIFFAGFASVGIMLLTAEVLDTAGNIFWNTESGHKNQWFFYDRIGFVGGAGLYYLSYAGFTFVLVGLFARIMPKTTLVSTLLFLGFLAIPYFFGHYEFVSEDDGKIRFDKQKMGTEDVEIPEVRLLESGSIGNPYCWGVVAGGLVGLVVAAIGTWLVAS